MPAVDQFLSGEARVGETVPEKVAGLLEWKEGHEKRCEDRQNEIKGLLKEQAASIKWVGRFVIGLIVAFLAWCLLELYHLQTVRLAPAPIQAAPPTIIYAPPGAAPVVVNPVQGQAPQVPQAPP